MNVFLDNHREAPDGFIYVSNVADCKTLLENQIVDILCLDHGLGKGNPTGYDLVKWIIEHRIHVGKVYLHSGNYLARRTMKRALSDYAQTHGTVIEVNDYPYPSP